MIPYIYLDKLVIGPLVMQTWGFFMALGIFLGTLLAIHRAKKFNIKSGIIVDCVFWLTLGAFIGGKVTYLLLNGTLSGAGSILSFSAGFSSIGAIIAGMVVTFFVIKKYRLIPSVVIQIFGPALLFADGIGRIGCFLNHEHLGRVTNFFLAVKYEGASRHDLGLYFALSSLVGSMLILFLEKRKMIPTSAVGWLSLIWYFLFRFVLEFCYENGGQFGVGKYFGLTLMQIAAIIFFMAVTILMVTPKEK